MKKTGLILAIITLTLNAFTQSNETYEETLGRMFTASGQDESTNESMDQMILMIAKVDTTEENEMWESLRTEMRETMLPELITMMAPIYEKYLTQADLQAIIDFYNTPVGKKYASSQSKITRDAFQVGQEWGVKVADRLMQKSGNK